MKGPKLSDELIKTLRLWEKKVMKKVRGACLRCHSAGAHRSLPGLAGFMLKLARGMKHASFLEAGNRLPFKKHIYAHICIPVQHWFLWSVTG